MYQFKYNSSLSEVTSEEDDFEDDSTFESKYSGSVSNKTFYSHPRMKRNSGRFSSEPSFTSSSEKANEITCNMVYVTRDESESSKLLESESYFSEINTEKSFERKNCGKSFKCDNPCFPDGVEVSTLTTSGRRKAKIYSLLEEHHLAFCNCKKSDENDSDPLISLLLDKKGKPYKSIVRLKDYDILMSKVFKYIYPSAYTPTFKFTLKPSLVKHVKDLDKFQKVLVGKSQGLAGSSDEEKEEGVDRDIIKNLRMNEETKFLADYNAAEMAARMSGCDPIEAETWALNANRDFDVNLSNIRMPQTLLESQEQIITVLGYVGITRPHGYVKKDKKDKDECFTKCD